MEGIKHLNLVEYIEVGKRQHEDWILMDYFPMKSVESYFAAQPSRRTLESVLRVVDHTLQGLIHLGLNGVVHRDIKPSNILVRLNDQGELEFVICDYGLSRQRSANDSMTFQGEAAAWYACVDSLDGDSSVRYSSLVDIRALGATLYRLLSGRPPLYREASSARIGREFLGLPGALRADHDTTVSLATLKPLLQVVKPISLCTLDPGIPQELSDLVDRWLSINRVDRVPAGLDLSNEQTILEAALVEVKTIIGRLAGPDRLADPHRPVGGPLIAEKGLPDADEGLAGSGIGAHDDRS